MSDLKFTDDDLRRLKTNNYLLPDEFPALLARLDAAEIRADTLLYCMKHKCDPFPCGSYLAVDSEWRKAAGKI